MRANDIFLCLSFKKKKKHNIAGIKKILSFAFVRKDNIKKGVQRMANKTITFEKQDN